HTALDLRFSRGRRWSQRVCSQREVHLADRQTERRGLLPRLADEDLSWRNKEPRQVTDGCERCGNDSSEHEKRVDSHAAIVYIRLGVEVKRVLATLPKSPETSLGLWRQDVPLCQSVNRQFPVVERVLSVHVFVNFRVLETVTQANDEMVEY